MKYFEANPTLFINNRNRFIQQMDKNAVAVFRSNDEIISNADALYPYKPNSDLYWLTGVVQENSWLILCPDYPEKKYRSILFIQKYDALKEKWDGKRLTPEEAKALSGIETVMTTDDIDVIITLLGNDNATFYLNTNEHNRKPNYLPTGDYRLAEEIKSKFPLHQYKRSATILKSLRGIKTHHEIDMLQKAVDVTHKTFLHLLKFIKPDTGEYEIEGEIVKMFYAQKSNGPAYSSVIASGKNACILHYIDNNNICRDGDLLLLDFGANYSGYCADLSRTIPVNGKFTNRQKEVYNGCLHLHNYAKSILNPGITLADYTEKVGKEAGKVFVKLGLLSPADIKNGDKQHPAYRKYLYHGISHHLGIDVHDLGDMLNPVTEDMLFTVEPGIYIAEEGIGIRIENDIWIKKGENIDLMKDIPITAEEIENCMAQQ